MIYAIYANYIVYSIEYDTSIYNAPNAPLMPKKQLIATAVSQINLIYKQIKKNE